MSKTPTKHLFHMTVPIHTTAVIVFTKLLNVKTAHLNSISGWQLQVNNYPGQAPGQAYNLCLIDIHVLTADLNIFH